MKYPTLSALFSLCVACSCFGGSCDTVNFTNFKLYNQKTVAVTKSAMTFSAASTLASQAGGKLVEPMTTDFSVWLNSNGYTGLIGIYDPAYTPNYNGSVDVYRFYYATSGGIPWLNWASGEPNNPASQEDINANVSPLGEHWVNLRADGFWESVGNHANSTFTSQAVVEFPTVLDCMKPTADPNTAPVTGYWCTDQSHFSQCQCATGTTANAQGGCDGAGACDSVGGTWDSASQQCKSGGTSTYQATATTGLSLYIVDYIETFAEKARPIGSFISEYNGIATEISSNSMRASAYSRGTLPTDKNRKFGVKLYEITTNGIQGASSIYVVGYTTTSNLKYGRYDYFLIQNSSTYTCSQGGTLSGTTCTINTTVYKQPSCPTGQSVNTTTGKCSTVPSVCPLGGYGCYSAADPSNTFNQDTSMGAMDKKNDGTKNADGSCAGKIYIFNGKDMRCRSSDAFGLAGSCCDAKSVLLGLIQCNGTEREWGKLTESGKCHKVGNYCAKKFLGVCMTTKESHCCFSSKLSRIIHEQGRPQLGWSWGSAQSPNCKGFTPEEFQKIDFSLVDFSEFVADLQNTTNTMGQDVSKAIQNFTTNNLGGK